MGGAVKSVGKAVGGLGGLAAGALGKVPVVGPVLGPAASIAMGGNPFLAIGSGIYDAVNAGGGGGGGGGSGGGVGGGSSTPTYLQPGFNYGANTYTIGGNPYDASKYFITGDKGVYNLLPELGNLYGNPTTDRLPGATSYNVYDSIYNKMAGDAAAQAAFASAYGPQTFTPVIPPRPTLPTTGQHQSQPWEIMQSRQNPYSMKGVMKDFTGPDYLRKDIRNAFKEQLDAYRIANKGPLAPRQGFTTPAQTRPVFTPTPIQYSNFGFGKNAITAENPLNALADYAAAQKNQFFVPFAPTTPTTPTGNTGTTPAPAPAPAPAALPAPQGGDFRPVNIRTGGLASLRRK